MKQKKPDHLEHKRPLFFSIGLCTSLLFIYVLFQVKTYPNQVCDFPKTAQPSADIGLEIPITRPKKPQPPELIEEIKKVKKKMLSTIMIEVPNNWDVNDESDSLFVIDEIDFGTNQVENMIIDLPALDKKPVFPGCEQLISEDERFACFQEKIVAFVQRNYQPCERHGVNYAEKLYVKFVIDENGLSTDAQIVRGLDQCNMQNALDLVMKLPRMKPGMYRDKVVKTSFVLPIKIK